MVDPFLCALHLIAAHSTDTAQDTAWLFLHNVVRLHGHPRSIFSDRDVRFLSIFWKSLCVALDVERCLTSGFYTQTNGLAERTNQTVKQVIRALFLGLADWTLALDGAEIAINNATLAGTGVSLFSLYLGYNPRVWPDVEHDVDPELAVQDDVATFTKRLDASWEAARLALSDEVAGGGTSPSSGGPSLRRRIAGYRAHHSWAARRAVSQWAVEP